MRENFKQGVFMAESKKKASDNIEDDESSFLYEEEFEDEEEIFLDDDPYLDESLMSGDKKAIERVVNVYNGLNCICGDYHRGYNSAFFKYLIRIMPLIILAGFYAYGILCAVRGEFDFKVAIIMVACTAFVIVFFRMLREEKITVWWWREGDRTVSVYKIEKGSNKGDIVVYVNREYMWRYDRKQDQWKINDLDLMGSRLLFEEFKGRLASKSLRNGDVKISAYGRRQKCESANLVLKGDIPLYIENIKIDTAPGNHGVFQQRFIFKEVNSGVSVALPESFKEFCEENVIKPLEEGEHLYYI